jgi:hypothetical protein
VFCWDSLSVLQREKNQIRVKSRFFAHKIKTQKPQRSKTRKKRKRKTAKKKKGRIKQHRRTKKRRVFSRIKK